MKRTIWNIKSGFFTVLFLVFAIVSCEEQGNNAVNSEREVMVETMSADPAAFEDIVRVTGTVEAIEDAMISAETSGRVLSIADRGDRIRRGDILMELDDRMVRSGLEMALANYELAEDALQRQEPLARDSIISTLAFNQARAQRDQARSQLDQARKQLKDTRMEAPFTGTIEDRMVNIGELVSPGIPVLRLVNTQRVRINAGVPERYINDISQGSPVKIGLRSYGRETIEADVRYASSVIVPETRTFPIEVVIRNSEGLLKPEMVVDLSITRSVLEDAVVVPRTALVRDEIGMSLFVIKENDEGVPYAFLRPVKTGLASGSRIVIEEGIEPGEVIVVTGQTNLGDGDRVRVLNQRDLDAYK
ncbi:efflux RND transporter periplasmic adaptor subunit [Balneolaceae bacterium ANBcel3]|nr:efflux RND transporter periplasmic adaptor subunit [Balneolaceae bacterium ANBcel3]